MFVMTEQPGKLLCSLVCLCPLAAGEGFDWDKISFAEVTDLYKYFLFIMTLWPFWGAFL